MTSVLSQKYSLNFTPFDQLFQRNRTLSCIRICLLHRNIILNAYNNIHNFFNAIILKPELFQLMEHLLSKMYGVHDVSSTNKNMDKQYVYQEESEGDPLHGANTKGVSGKDLCQWQNARSHDSSYNIFRYIFYSLYFGRKFVCLTGWNYCIVLYCIEL